MIFVEDLDAVVAALHRHPGELMSTRRCRVQAFDDPERYYVPLVLGIEVSLWKKHGRGALKRVNCTRIGIENEFKGGIWFFLGDALPPCLVDALGMQCKHAEDADLRRSLSSDDTRRGTKRPNPSSRKSQSGAEFRDDDEPMNVSAAPVPESGVVGEEGLSDEAFAAAPRHGNHDTSPPPPPGSIVSAAAAAGPGEVHWACCDDCEKWRRLPPTVNPNAQPGRRRGRGWTARRRGAGPAAPGTRRRRRRHRRAPRRARAAMRWSLKVLGWTPRDFQSRKLNKGA